MHPAEFGKNPNASSCPDLDTAKAIVSNLASVKSRQDVKAALEIYHRNATLLCPPWQSRAKGRDQIEKSLVSFFSLVPDYVVELANHAMAGDTLCSWGTIRMTLSTTPGGYTPNGRKVSTPVFILFRFDEGQVIWESFHFDLADVARQSGVPNEAFVRAPESLFWRKAVFEVHP
jgi:predicted ester cyclase